MDDTSIHLGDYFKPKSLTWWSGVVMALIGISMYGPIGDLPYLGGFAQLFAAMAGTDASPAALILGGTGLIGLRAKLGRANRGSGSAAS